MSFSGCVPTGDVKVKPTRLGPKHSLQLRSMPDLREACKRGPEDKDGETDRPGPRDIVRTEPRYNSGVLQDNWFEDRCEYTRNVLPGNQHFRSVYGADYRQPHPPAKREFDAFYDEFFMNEGAGHDVMFNHGGEAYEHNHSTTYDLCYNHLAKCDPNPKLKTYGRYLQNFIPQQDLAENHGDITNYGLREYMNQVWNCEKRNEYLKLTEMQDKYRPMREEDLENLRVAVPKAYSSAIYEVNAKNRDVTLRGNPVRVVTNGIVNPQKPNARCLIEAYHRTMGARRLRK